MCNITSNFAIQQNAILPSSNAKIQTSYSVKYKTKSCLWYKWSSLVCLNDLSKGPVQNLHQSRFQTLTVFLTDYDFSRSQANKSHSDKGIEILERNNTKPQLSIWIRVLTAFLTLNKYSKNCSKDAQKLLNSIQNL